MLLLRLSPAFIVSTLIMTTRKLKVARTKSKKRSRSRSTEFFLRANSGDTQRPHRLLSMATLLRSIPPPLFSTVVLTSSRLFVIKLEAGVASAKVLLLLF
jgi:hypothetical protein